MIDGRKLQHTPGPWRVDASWVQRGNITATYWIKSQCVSLDGAHVASVSAVKTETDRREERGFRPSTVHITRTRERQYALADAHLIAAAPHLYAAARKACDALQGWDMSRDQPMTREISEALLRAHEELVHAVDFANEGLPKANRPPTTIAPTGNVDGEQS
jgi:L-alanine-DL-glutamate epimerase-like enolase superfamily enzyme